MAVYRLTHRAFSRTWRRSKNYREHEIKWLARRRGLTVREQGTAIEVLDPKTGKLAACFQPVSEVQEAQADDRSRAFAALKGAVSILLLLLVQTAPAQTQQEKVVAAVLMGEARGEGEQGMLAVAEVISQRSKEKRQTPLQVVTHKVKSVHAFSCLNNTTPDALVAKFQKESLYATAVRVAQTACQTPDRLPGITKQATHFSVTGKTPWWAKDQKPVAVVGRHTFYRMARY